MTEDTQQTLPPALAPIEEQLAAVNAGDRLPPGRIHRGLVAAALVLPLAGCVVNAPGAEAPTQTRVASTEIGSASVGLEADDNGMFNGRDPVEPSEGEYNSTSLLDKVPGLPNLVVGVADPEADGAPKGDGNFATSEAGAEKGRDRESKDTIDLTVKIPIKTHKPTRKPVGTEAVITNRSGGDTQYERDFEIDKNTAEQALVPASEVADETLQLVEDGYTVTSVHVTGKASGEDHTTNDPMANIGESSANNQDLARQRGSEGFSVLSDALESRGIDLSNIATSLDAVETEPTPQQTDKLLAAAETMGISLDELTERFNKGIGSFDPETLQTLHEALTNNRGVMYEIHATKTEMAEVPGFKTTVIKLPMDVLRKIAGKDQDGDWLFRVEIPGEALLLLMGLALGKLAANAGGLPIPMAPPMPRTPPAEGPPRLPEIPPADLETPKIPFPGLPKIKTPGPKPPPPPGTPLYRPSFRLERGSFTPSIADRGSVGVIRQQPREHNFSKQPSLRAGGTGRMSRNKGGNKG